MLHSVFDKITFIMISRSGCIVFSVPVLPVGSKLKIGQTFSNSFFKKNILFQTSCSKSRKKSYQWHSIHSHTSYPDSKPSKKKENMYSLLYRCVFFCLGLLKLIFFDTGSVGFAHFEVDFFVLQQFLRQKGTKPPNFDRTCPAFCQKKNPKNHRELWSTKAAYYFFTKNRCFQRI